VLSERARRCHPPKHTAYIRIRASPSPFTRRIVPTT
jgi:hypothetical protein